MIHSCPGSCPGLTDRLSLRSLKSIAAFAAVWLLITGLCLKNVYSVVKEHLVRRPRNNLVVTGKIVSAEGMILKGREVPVSDPLSTGRERTVRNAKRISESYVEIRALQPEFSVRFMS